jgi:hypothetical protein
MSVSTRSSPTSSRPATISEQLTRMTPREWLLSFGLHLAVFALLIWLLPVRELITGTTGKIEGKSEFQASSVEEALKQDPERIREVVEQIDATQSDSARTTVEDLLNSEHEMDALTRANVDRLNQQAKRIAMHAAQEAITKLQKVVGQQDGILADQAKLNDQVTVLLAKINEAQQAASDANKSMAAVAAIGPMQDPISQLQDNIRKNEVATEDLQNKASEVLTYSGDSFKAQADTQAHASQAQASATDFQTNLASLQARTLSALNTWSGQSTNARSLDASRAQLQPEVDALDRQLPSLQQATDLAAKNAQDAHNAAQLAAAKADQTKLDADRQAANLAKTAADSARFAQDVANKALQQARNDESSKRSTINSQADQIKQAKAAAQSALTTLAASAQQWPAALAQSRLQETVAEKQQQDALAQLAAAVQQKSSTAGGITPAQFSAPILNRPEPDADSLRNENLAALYHEAQAAEERISEKYQNFSAAQLAMIRRMSLTDALALTQVARPDREKLDAGLLGAVGATANLNAYKDEVLKADGQLASMATLASNMVAQAESEKDLGAGNGNGNGTGDDFDGSLQMESDATANDQTAGRDLTGIMQGTGVGNGQGTGSGPNAGDGSNYQSPLEERARYAAVRAYPRNAPELPDMDYDHIKPYATRRITENGAYHAAWLYVDSWYLLGPFPNPGRQNLNTKFPPESIVDLNAVYSGKNGTPIHWVFTQWNEPSLSPPHDFEDAPAIYYAYTELYFDHPCDLWIASGSDDKGTMWINHVMVWKSGDQLKSWMPNEGYRKVHFLQGYNRILYRLENAQLAAVFSLMISTKGG